MRSIRRPATVLSAVALAAGTAFGGALAAGDAGADPYDPYQQKNYVKKIRCNSADPWGGSRLRVYVDVYNAVRFPSDGGSRPAIELIAGNPRPAESPFGIKQYTSETTVTYRNVSTGRTGKVRVPTRARSATWTAVLHPGAGQVNFTIRQKIGALIGVPMVNPKYSTCKGSVRAV